MSLNYSPAMMSKLALSTKESSMFQKRSMLSSFQASSRFFSTLTRMSSCLRSSSHSFFFFQDSQIGVWAVRQSVNSSPILFLILCLMTMHFQLALMVFSSILVLFWISSSWLLSKSLSSSSLLRQSFFSLCMNWMALRQLMMVVSTKKLSSTFSQALKLLQLISIISRPIASSSFIQNSLLQISSCSHISRLLLRTMKGSTMSPSTLSKWNPMNLMICSSLSEMRCFLSSLERTWLISCRVSSAGKRKMTLLRSSSSQHSMILWQKQSMCEKSFSLRQEMMILSKTSSRMQLLPITIISWMSSLSYSTFAPFWSSYLRQAPKMFFVQASLSRFFMADLVSLMLLFQTTRFSETSCGFMRILETFLRGLRVQERALFSAVRMLTILKAKIISSYFSWLKYRIFVPGYYYQSQLFFLILSPSSLLIFSTLREDVFCSITGASSSSLLLLLTEEA